MSRNYRFRVVNVFAQSKLEGNPLAVIEDARGLSDIEMQQLALQFNLSEITFIFAHVHGRTPQQPLSSEEAHADAVVRIFTPTFEMPFAGHPTLGTAHVLRAIRHGGDELKLEMKAGVIPVSASGDVWTLTAKAPTHRPCEYSSKDVAAALGLKGEDIAGPILWVNAGVEQLIVPLANADAVARTTPHFERCRNHCSNDAMGAQAYVFARRDATSVVARYFFQQGPMLLEDPGTGSACANLGGYLLATNAALPLRVDVHQGAATGRPCLLHLSVDAERHIRVGGRVVELMAGEIELD